MNTKKRKINIQNLVSLDLGNLDTDTIDQTTETDLKNTNVKAYDAEKVEKAIYNQVDQALEKQTLQEFKTKILADIKIVNDLKLDNQNLSNTNNSTNLTKCLSLLAYKKYKKDRDNIKSYDDILRKLTIQLDIINEKLDSSFAKITPKASIHALSPIKTTDAKNKTHEQLVASPKPILPIEKRILKHSISILNHKNLLQATQFRFERSDDSILTHYKCRIENILVAGSYEWVLHAYMANKNLMDKTFLNQPFYHQIDSDFYLPNFIWEQLYDHQKTGVKWLWNIRRKGMSGAIIGDDMGLGKTIQIIALFIGLAIQYIQTQKYELKVATWNTYLNRDVNVKLPSKEINMDTLTPSDHNQMHDNTFKFNDNEFNTTMNHNFLMNVSRGLSPYHKLAGPVLIVCPVTLMHQWIHELHYWWPFFRVAILHQVGGKNKKATFTTWKRIINNVLSPHNGILITTYANLIIHQRMLSKQAWYYIVLDEGHKIRNANSMVSQAARYIANTCDYSQSNQTNNENTNNNMSCNRLILTGTPMQNDLRELWSLFDFCAPGRLGTLKAFMDNIAAPIVQSATHHSFSGNTVQAVTAYKCATILRDTIMPYMLRRSKVETLTTVSTDFSIPSKKEQILFCQISPYQKRAYQRYLDSFKLDDILRGRVRIFKALVQLRKICNHPDLVFPIINSTNANDEETIEYDQHHTFSANEFGYWRRSGKMRVLHELLQLWYENEHKVLVFCQTRQMLNIVERYFKHIPKYHYLRLDGTYSIKSRHEAVKQYNQNLNLPNMHEDSIFAMLLTTRVGGLGLNLTGADRVVIFDPDWNPCIDAQAKERAWRIGQTRSVNIYRLLLTGTIEEKIYHRQIFKQYITDKVLNNPKLQNRICFKMNDLRELFTLVDNNTNSNSNKNETVLSPENENVLKTVDGQPIPYVTKKQKYSSKRAAYSSNNKNMDKAGCSSSKSTKLKSKMADEYTILERVLGNEAFFTNPIHNDNLSSEGQNFERNLENDNIMHKISKFDNSNNATIISNNSNSNIIIREVSDRLAEEAYKKVVESRMEYQKFGGGIARTSLPESSPEFLLPSSFQPNATKSYNKNISQFSQSSKNENDLFFAQLDSNPLVIQSHPLERHKTQDSKSKPPLSSFKLFVEKQRDNQKTDANDKDFSSMEEKQLLHNKTNTPTTTITNTINDPTTLMNVENNANINFGQKSNATNTNITQSSSSNFILQRIAERRNNMSGDNIN